MEPYKPHQRRLAIAFVVTLGIAAAVMQFGDRPWWQVVLLAAVGAAAFWLKAFTR